MSPLKDLYSIEAKDNIWYNGRTKELSHGGALGLDGVGALSVIQHWLTVDQTLNVMLDRGEIDTCTAIRPGTWIRGISACLPERARRLARQIFMGETYTAPWSQCHARHIWTRAPSLLCRLSCFQTYRIRGECCGDLLVANALL